MSAMERIYRIEQLIAGPFVLNGCADSPAEEVKMRFRTQVVGVCHFFLSHFQSVSSALLCGKRMLIRYHARGTDQETEREISPPRLIYYRDNWYTCAKTCARARSTPSVRLTS